LDLRFSGHERTLRGSMATVRDHKIFKLSKVGEVAIRSDRCHGEARIPCSHSCRQNTRSLPQSPCLFVFEMHNACTESDPSRKILSLSEVKHKRQHKRQHQTVYLHRMYNWRCRLLAAHVLGILFQSADVTKHYDARERYQRVRIHNNPFHRSCRSSRSAQRNGSAILFRCLRCTQQKTILSTSSLRLALKASRKQRGNQLSD
jgi:hypothetical protein